MEPDDVERAAWPEPGTTQPPDAQAEPAREIPDPPVTGDDGVDSAAAEAAAALDDPLEAQLAAYERAHRTLQDRLADVEG